MRVSDSLLYGILMKSAKKFMGYMENTIYEFM
jgi:hypothetical protein